MDPCHLPRFSSRPASLGPFVHPFPRGSNHDLLGAFGFAPPFYDLPDVPNTCIGGSGAGTLEVFLLQHCTKVWRLPAIFPSLLRSSSPTQHACAPKSHIGGSGMTASHARISRHCSVEESICSTVCRWVVPSVQFSSFRYPFHGPNHFRRFEFWFRGFVRAPKSHIGGSGMTAVQPPACPSAFRPLGHHSFSPTSSQVTSATCMCGHLSVGEHVQARGHFPVTQAVTKGYTLDPQGTLRLLFVLGSFLVPFFRGTVVLMLLGLLRLLLWRRPTSSRAYSLLCLPLGGRCCDFVLPLGNIARPAAVLDWSVSKKHRKRPPREPSRCIWKVLLGCICTTFGVPSVPGPFFVSFPCACWILSPTCAAGMAREGWPDDLPVGPASVPVFAPVITAGVSDAWSPDHDPEREVRAEDSLRIHDLPWSAEHIGNCEDPCLGCYIYTPHYYPVALAVRMPAHADLRYAMDVLTDCAPGVPQGLFNAMVPVHPQRVPGYLSVIRFPAHIRGVHEGYAAHLRPH